LLKQEANLDFENNSKISPRRIIENFINSKIDPNRRKMLEAILVEYPEGKNVKFSKVESWLSHSIDELDEKESSIDSLQSLNEDIRTLRDENLQVTPTNYFEYRLYYIAYNIQLL